MVDEHIEHLLQQNENMPNWFKEKLKSIAWLDEKRKESIQPSWATRAFMKAVSDNVVHVMIRHGNAC
jgi:hypothetical protein